MNKLQETFKSYIETVYADELPISKNQEKELFYAFMGALMWSFVETLGHVESDSENELKDWLKQMIRESGDALVGKSQDEINFH